LQGQKFGDKGKKKKNGIKARCYWEHHWGTNCELEGNMLGTKERRKNSSSSLSPKTLKKKKKKTRHFECVLSLPIECMKFLCPKLFVTFFGLG
jgi:hypothetical protein